ncbi:MAG: NUDIX domain-containing protein, partial [Phycisphaerales bacterium]|nr:NUDIX domain-containing protein [Phycisphaerales bacterium]
MAPTPDRHCGFCGAAYADTQKGWPRTCAACAQTTFRNPLPVAVALLPILEADGRSGLLVVRRAIPPFIGALALPGGYVDIGEDWRQGALRELREEAHIDLKLDPCDIKIVDALSNPQGDRILIFATLPAMRAEALPPFTATHETSERSVIYGPTPLAFPLHTQVCDRYFATRSGPKTPPKHPTNKSSRRS